MPRLRYRDLLTIGFVVVLLVSNLIGPKICQLGPLRPSAAEFLFPLTYICGDIFTEVYGYGSSRRAIWLGFFAMALLTVMGQVAVALPPAPEWKGQEAFATVFGFVPRFAVASLVAYWAGEFTNSYTLAKLKLFTGGRWLWTRTVGSTVTGQFIGKKAGSRGVGENARQTILVDMDATGLNRRNRNRERVKPIVGVIGQVAAYCGWKAGVVADNARKLPSTDDLIRPAGDAA